MFFARKPFVRSTTLLAASAASFILLSSGVAQERDSGVELAAAVGQQPPSPVLNPRHPESYVVQRGDTLWDIASMFLRDPWYWPEIWQINPQVENPHLIFPGDTLSLAYLDDGRPVVNLERGPQVVQAGPGVDRLSPRVRAQPLEEAIQTIPYETIAAFLSRPRFIDEGEVDDMPYVVALREALIGSAGRDVYVRGLEEQTPVGSVFNVVELGGAFVDPDTNDVLGYQGTYVGQGRLDRTGDPGTLRMLETEREVLVGDYLAAEEDAIPLNFIPRSPESEIEGRIIATTSGVSLIGQFHVVVINRGTEAGLEPGHVLRAYQTGQTIRDTHRGLVGQKVRLPDEPAGTMMVFRTAERISYALVMEATTPLAVFDTVRNP
ncbi:MAG TPA: LysM peptidoglycan-binding domain-containing protein [Gammaproteobacteria bacterium]|nr:LysM peptidoglycan-binding domain-containing protein [Gammaproteobacteria bacterium]